jgi:hypothetical protein
MSKFFDKIYNAINTRFMALQMEDKDCGVLSVAVDESDVYIDLKINKVFKVVEVMIDVNEKIATDKLVVRVFDEDELDLMMPWILIMLARARRFIRG